MSENLKDLIKKYNNFNNKKKEFDKERKSIGKKIEEKMTESGLDKVEYDDIKVTKITRTNKKIDEEKLLEVMHKNNIDAIKEAPDMNKLEEMIDNNELDKELIEEIGNCITTSSYSYIRAKDKS